MTRICSITFHYYGRSFQDEYSAPFWEPAEETIYDGYFILKEDGRIIGYTHAGVLVGSQTEGIVERSMQYYAEYPFPKGIQMDHLGLTIQYELGKGKFAQMQIIPLNPKIPTNENEKIILESVRRRAKKLSKEEQETLNRLYLS